MWIADPNIQTADSNIGKNIWERWHKGMNLSN